MLKVMRISSSWSQWHCQYCSYRFTLLWLNLVVCVSPCTKVSMCTSTHLTRPLTHKLDISMRKNTRERGRRRETVYVGTCITNAPLCAVDAFWLVYAGREAWLTIVVWLYARLVVHVCPVVVAVWIVEGRVAVRTCLVGLLVYMCVMRYALCVSCQLTRVGTSEFIIDYAFEGEGRGMHQTESFTVPC